MMSPRLCGPAFWIMVCESTETGVGCSRLGRGIREPVTTSSPTVLASSAAACAQAAPPEIKTPASRVEPNRMGFLVTRPRTQASPDVKTDDNTPSEAADLRLAYRAPLQGSD